ALGPVSGEVECPPITVLREMYSRITLRGNKGIEQRCAADVGTVKGSKEVAGRGIAHSPQGPDERGDAGEEKAGRQSADIVAQVESAQRGLAGAEGEQPQAAHIEPEQFVGVQH